VYERYSRPQRIGSAIIGRVWSFRDVTERERLLIRQTLLADISRLLGSLDVESALDAVARRALPFLGDACAIDVLENGEPRRLVSHALDPTRAFSPAVPSAVLAGQSMMYEVGEVSYVAVPLSAKETRIGAVTFAAPAMRRYTRADLEVVEEVAVRIALALENARLFRGAEDALRARDELLSIAAHEIRGPLASIHLGVQALQDRDVPQSKRDRMIALMEREDRRLARFVEDLVDLGRIRTGRLEINLADIDLRDVVDDVAEQVAWDRERSGSALTITGDRVIGEWDRFRLEQVVLNLLRNAIKFGLGRPIEIAIEATQGWAKLAVTDHGLGVPAERREAIFLPFERGVSVRHYGGLGLGLFIVQTIVTRLHGTVHVEPTPGGGSCFVVKLPQRRRA
jgi:signal transduction histidine kinase